MDDGYKLEALMIRKELYIDDLAEAVKEVRAEYGKDEALDQWEDLMKGYDGRGD